MRKPILFIAMLASLATPAPALEIIASIKPVALIIGALAAPDDEVITLIETRTTPHHYQLRPSELRALKRADLVVWVSPHLEVSIEKAVAALGLGNKALRLMEDLRLQRFDYREENGHSHATIDPHIWLSPYNAARIAENIVRKLSALSPVYESEYRARMETLNARIDEAAAEVHKILHPPTAPYMMQHNAIGYFERHYGLQSRGYFHLPNANLSGSSTLARLKREINDAEIRCIMIEPAFDPRPLKAWLDAAGVKLVPIDPLGVQLPDGAGYPELLTGIAHSLSQCR